MVKERRYHWQEAAAQVEQLKINALSAPSLVFKAKIIKRDQMREQRRKEILVQEYNPFKCHIYIYSVFEYTLIIIIIIKLEI